MTSLLTRLRRQAPPVSPEAAAPRAVAPLLADPFRYTPRMPTQRALTEALRSEGRRGTQVAADPSQELIILRQRDHMGRVDAERFIRHPDERLPCALLGADRTRGILGTARPLVVGQALDRADRSAGDEGLLWTPIHDAVASLGLDDLPDVAALLAARTERVATWIRSHGDVRRIDRLLGAFVSEPFWVAVARGIHRPDEAEVRLLLSCAATAPALAANPALGERALRLVEAWGRTAAGGPDAARAAIGAATLEALGARPVVHRPRAR